MRYLLAPLLVLALTTVVLAQANARPSHALTISGTRFLLDEKPFEYTGVSFFNAIYNPAFNASAEARIQWLQKFSRFGINVLRVWCQWDNARGFVDAGPASTLYAPDGALIAQHLERLKQILTDADRCGMVIELSLFARESRNEKKHLAPEAADKAVAALARELLPWRNVTFQVWNENDERVPELFKVIKGIDPRRLVTNSPGYSGFMGTDEENRILDYLTPHTSRQGKGKPWELAPREIADLIKKFDKPVVDDEPARNGTAKFGGPKQQTSPYDHVLQIWEVWKVGGYVTYHHDMFQMGYGAESVPKDGIPDPEFSPYHKAVFDFLAHRERYRAPRNEPQAGGANRQASRVPGPHAGVFIIR